jgi:predicted nucleotidyltransferase
MTPAAIEPSPTDIARALHDALRQIYGDNLRGVYLYGSRARNEAQPESDLDILIVLREFADYWLEIKRTGAIVSGLSLQYGMSISPVRIRETDWLHQDSPFLNAVRRECIAA